MSTRRTLEPFEGDLVKAAALVDGAPDVAVVLGSGLGGVADAVDDAREVAYEALEGMRVAGAVAGHADRLIGGTVAGKRVLLFQGRIHMYQGIDAHAAAYTSRLAAAAGATALIVTNAAGSVSEHLSAGDLMLITDHINLMGDNPLVGWAGPEGGVPFVPMGAAYDERLAALARESAAALGVELKEGVYAGLLGPSYETPAEVRYLKSSGADAVGMSTVPEVIAARALGMRVLGISSITNAAGGSALSHDEVLEAGERAASSLTRLLSDILARL